MEDFAFYSYLTGLIVFLLILPLAFRRINKNPFVPQFIIALIVSILWMAYVVFTLSNPEFFLADTFALETLRNAAWLFFLNVVISTQLFAGKYAFLRKSKASLLLFAWLIFVFTVEISPQALDLSKHYLGQDIRLFAHLSFALIGLMLVEKLYRGVDKERRWAIKYLCLGLGAMFAFDFIIYSKSLLFGQLDFMLWDSRGVINALCAPLLAISFSRLQDDANKVTISRTVVVHTTVLFGAGLYMVLMSLAGFYIKNFGGSWGGILQTFFIFLAVIFLLIVFASGKMRAYIKVYFNKHFFQHNYDYREEWIKLSREIASLESLDDLTQFVIKTLADLIGSAGGGLWLSNGQGYFYLADERSLGFNTDVVLEKGDKFIHFLNDKQWVIDFCEYTNDPDMYDSVDLSAWTKYKDIWVIIPLLQQNKVIAFVVLTQPFVRRPLNYEEHDLLKTVGMQLANVLTLSKVTDDLTRARQFEAYSRFSAFLVHDIKNLVAQISMIVRNAENHKHNPEFIDDAIDTLENVVNKMERLLTQLKKGQGIVKNNSAIILQDILSDVILQQSGNLPAISFERPPKDCMVLANKQRLTAIIGHLVQNAQDATLDDGEVKMHLSCELGYAIITITDTGCGMDKKFIAERLFKPFDTTKGNAGMGIGVYEAREYIISQKGEILVQSEPGTGTVFSIKYPLMMAQA